MSNGAVGTDVSDHHELTIVINLENVTREEAVRNGEDCEVLAVNNE